MEIRILHRQGKSIKAIARELGVSRTTVRKYLRSQSAPGYGPRAPRASKLDAYKCYIESRIKAAHPQWIPSSVLLREIRELGYGGGWTILRDYVARLKPQKKPDPVVRFETAPGEQMQIDWGAFRLGERRISAFVATLGWSRYSYVEFVENERFETLRACHEHAFEYFEGVPREGLYDNMRTVVQQRHAYGEGLHRFHPGLRDLAHHYGFTPRLCRPYRAKTKGKVERFIHYLRHSFYTPLISRYAQQGLALDLDTLNVETQRWLREVCNARRHRTTGEIPAERLVREREALQALPPSYLVAEPIIDLTGEHTPQVYLTEVLQHPLSVYESLLEEAEA